MEVILRTEEFEVEVADEMSYYCERFKNEGGKEKLTSWMSRWPEELYYGRRDVICEEQIVTCSLNSFVYFPPFFFIDAKLRIGRG